jgi:hypothetical protein
MYSKAISGDNSKISAADAARIGGLRPIFLAESAQVEKELGSPLPMR